MASILRDRNLVLVADLTSCVLLDSLGVLRDGSLAARRLAIAQSTLDEFRGELLRWRTQPPDGFMSLGLHDGKLVRFDISADDVKAIRERYESLAAWLKEHCAVLAVTPAVAEKHAAQAKLASFIGESFWDSMLIATEPKRTLLSDDLALRRIFGGLAGRASVCSPLLLLAEASEGRVASDRYGDSIVGLVTSGYRLFRRMLVSFRRQPRPNSGGHRGGCSASSTRSRVPKPSLAQRLSSRRSSSGSFGSML